VETSSVDPLDDLDRRILLELQEDGRRSYREIAKKVGAAPGTVRSRVLGLSTDGMFEVVGVPNLYRMGFRFHALLGISVEPGRVDEMADLLVPREEVTWVGLTANGYDLLVEVALHDAQEFGRYRQDVLAHLPGFRSADVFVYWDVRKLHYRVGGTDNGTAGGRGTVAGSSNGRTTRRTRS